MPICETHPDYWQVAYGRFRTMGDASARKDEELVHTNEMTSSATREILEIPFPKRIFTAYPFKRRTRAEVDLVA